MGENEQGQAIEQREAENTSLILRPIAAIGAVIQARKETAELIAGNLQEKRDYGLIPGVDKPSLFQPGAEQVNQWFGVRPEFSVVEREIDHHAENEWIKSKWTKADKPDQKICDEMRAAGTGKFRPGKKDASGKVTEWEWSQRSDERGVAVGLYRYVVSCRLIRRETGEEIGQAVASCSSLESKYCDRPRECENTVLQMAEKRAYVRVTRNTYGLSDRFTQDVEDFARDDAPATTTAHTKETRPPVSTPKPASKPAADAPGSEVQGTIESVSIKSSEPGAKKPWTKYGVSIGGEWYGTFDSNLGETARELEGGEVVIGWKQDGKYKTLISIVSASAAALVQSEEDRQLDLAAAAQG